MKLDDKAFKHFDDRDVVLLEDATQFANQMYIDGLLFGLNLHGLVCNDERSLKAVEVVEKNLERFFGAKVKIKSKKQPVLINTFESEQNELKIKKDKQSAVTFTSQVKDHILNKYSDAPFKAKVICDDLAALKISNIHLILIQLVKAGILKKVSLGIYEVYREQMT